MNTSSDDEGPDIGDWVWVHGSNVHGVLEGVIRSESGQVIIGSVRIAGWSAPRPWDWSRIRLDRRAVDRSVRDVRLG